MPSVVETLQIGLAHHSSGRLVEAEAAYRGVLGGDPRNADALHLLGMVFHQRGRNREAAAYISQAIRVNGRIAPFHNNLGNILLAQGRFAEAAEAFDHALELNPGSVETCVNRALALKALGRFQEAETGCREVLRRRPDLTVVWLNLSAILRDAGRLEDAEVSCREALRREPGAAAAHANLAAIYLERKQFREAEECARYAVDLDPNHAIAQNNLASALEGLGRDADALAGYQRALALDPGLADAHFNLGMVLLRNGDFERGWAEYEWRWKAKPRAARQFRQPVWDGSELAGRTILLHAEQGLGDAIQFIRYAGMVRARGGRVVVECPERLTPLLETVEGVAAVVRRGARLPRFDVHAPLLSLPGIFGTRIDKIPADVPYLRLESWARGPVQKQMSAQPKRVGLVWSGSKENPYNRIRSIPVARLAVLAGVPNAAFYGLQRDLDATEAKTAAELEIENLEQESGSLADTAAAIAGLDLVIAVDTMVAHLAGALGRPVWLLLPFAADWRWLRDRTDSPWYPTMRLFRQPQPGGWQAVLKNVREALTDANRG